MPEERTRIDDARQNSTVERYVERLLKGPARYTLGEAAAQAGMGVDVARRFWLSMGFPTITDEESNRVFTDDDVAAMTRHQQLLADGVLSAETLNSLIRAESHMSDRVVLWQHEALVQHAERILGGDMVSARFWALDHFEDFQQFLQEQMEYSWRRHLASLMRRSEAEASEMDRRGDTGEQLQRALGFVDMVAFTNRSNELGAADLVKLIEVFEHTCRDVITANGARVVKTIGDAFLFIADDLVTGADVATEIVERLRNEPEMLPVRASLVWGGVVSRFGDIFGPTVNLASRLVDIAAAGSVYTDQNTASILRQLKLGRFTLVPAGSPDLKGVGKIEAVELRRMPTR
ncbi:adenylate/guanylate cyclase domain-containing protein [Actinomycetaceae bacterium L2_0104]